MRVVTGPAAAWGLEPRRRALTVGVYDGVHLGHRHVLALLRRRASEMGGLETGVVTFDPHPLQVVAPEHAPALLAGLEHRLELLAEMGMDLAVVLAFDEEVRRLTSAAFAATVLVEALGAQLVVVGEDFRFGHNRTGNIASLAELGDAHGFATEVARLVGGDEPVSSTRIRQMVAAGEVAAAAAALGRPHEVRGRVERGAGRGAALGIPTANVGVPPDLALPRRGVYAVRAGRLGGERWPGVANVGVRPTFGCGEEVVEVHLFGFSGDLYGSTLAVAFVEWLREERLFTTPDDLAAQIGDDVAAARRALG